MTIDMRLTGGHRLTRTMTEEQGSMGRATRCGKTCKVEVSRLTGKPRPHGVEFPAKRQKLIQSFQKSCAVE